MNRKIISIAIIVITLCTAVYAIAAPPADEIAIVVAVRGGVSVIRNSQASRLSLKSSIYKSDTIITGRRGRVQLLFKDTTIVSLARNTRMNVADYSWDPAAKKGVMKTKVKEGTFRIMGGAITKFSPKHFTTETPTATIGIRGSMYAGTVTANSLSVVFQGGKGIDIMNAAGSVAITKPGFGTHVQGVNQPPMPPKKFSAADMAIINNALTGPVEPEEGAPPGDSAASEGERDGQSADSGDQPPADDGQVAGEEAAPQTTDGADEPIGTDDQPPPPDEQVAPAEGTAPPADGTMPPADGTTPPPDDQIVIMDGELPPLDDSLPPPTESVDQFGLDAPIVDASVDNVVDGASVDSAQTTTATSSVSASATLPTDGLSEYSGLLSGSGGGGAIDANMFMVTNWRSRKVLGVIEDSSDPNAPHGATTFFFGDITDTGVNNIKIFGSDVDDGSGTVYTHQASGASGSFYGDSYQFFDFSAIGDDYDIKTQSLVTGSSWNVASTTAREFGLPDGSVPTGTHYWKGFVSTVAENMNNPDVDRKRFMNNDSSNFHMTVDKTNGVINGVINADSLEDGDENDDNIVGLNIGGGLGSVYVRDDIVAAVIGCSGNCIDTDPITYPDGTLDHPVGNYGGYMITAGPEEQMSPYFTWGYWEVAFADNSSNRYHAHIPGSFWLAGSRTADLNSSYITPSFKATYDGTARGVAIPSTGGMQDMGKGICHLDIDLSTTAKAKGYIDFPNFVNLTIGGTGGIITGGNVGFRTDITNIYGTVNGAFYGAQANAVGGNFEAYDSGSTTSYMGIFGANR